MICSSCMRRLSSNYKSYLPIYLNRTASFLPPSVRTFKTSTACRISPAEPTPPAPHQGSPSDSRHPPAATSTSAAQPFSTPRTPRPAQMPPTTSQGNAPPVVSSVPGGTPLMGLSYMKNKPDPVALEDWEYPPWLWTLLQPKGGPGATADADADLYAKSKKQRRAAAKRLRKEEKNKIYKEKEVPLYEQTIDLPTSDGTLEGATDADSARDDLTKAMRKKRRADIKESNFLRTMR